jgi:hypothetical protein
LGGIPFVFANPILVRSGDDVLLPAFVQVSAEEERTYSLAKNTLGKPPGVREANPDYTSYSLAANARSPKEGPRARSRAVAEEEEMGDATYNLANPAALPEANPNYAEYSVGGEGERDRGKAEYTAAANEARGAYTLAAHVKARQGSLQNHLAEVRLNGASRLAGNRAHHPAWVEIAQAQTPAIGVRVSPL